MMMAEDLARERLDIFQINWILILILKRDEDVNRLIDNINKLNHLFKQMNDIVIEQGTIVDRIDFNIEQSADLTRKAKKELFEVSPLLKLQNNFLGWQSNEK